MSDSPNKLSQFWQELKRRKVVRVIAMYAGVAYIIIELVSNITEPLHLPDWTTTLVILLLAIGFPITAILSWIFDVTPEGLKKTESIKEVSDQESATLPTTRGLKMSDVIIAVLLVAVCILLYPKIFAKDKFKEFRDSDGIISVAVMPFENLTGESSNNIWQKGISEYLINDLGASEELSVISTQEMQEILSRTNQVTTASISSAMARETAGMLNANTYITGNFIGSINNISILLNLVSSENGELVWSCRVEGDLGTRYQKVLGNLANTLRNYLEIRALEDEAGLDFSKAFTNSSEAYRHYINGVNALVDLDVQAAQSSLIRAVEIDSTFTLAAFYLAWATYTGNPSIEDTAFWIHRAHSLKQNLPTQLQTWINLWYAYMNEDKEGMLKACTIMGGSDIQSRFYWYDLGTYYQLLQDYEKALNAFRKVEALNESWNDEWRFTKYYESYVRSLLETGRLNEMDRIAEKGLKIDPENRNLVVALGAKSVLQNDTVSLGYYKELIKKVNKGDVNPEASNAHDIGDMYKWIGDYQTAIGYFRKAYELDPGRNWSHYNIILLDLQDNGDAEKCLLLIDAELDRNPRNWQFLWLKGYALFKLNRNEEALAMLTEADDMTDYRISLKNDIRDVELAISRQER